MIWIVVVAMLFVGCSQKKSERLTFEAGTYEVTAQGHNGDIRLSVTFSDSCITDIQVLEQHETPHIGDIVFDELIPRIIQANGTGVNASMEGRELSAVQQADGTWKSRAYTVCLPFYAELLGSNADFTIYSKAEITQDGELLFTEEMLPFLYPGNAYLIVVNEGTLRLQEEGVTLIAEADEADVDMNSVLLNNGNGQIAGYWLGSLKTISHDEAVSRKAFTLASDGSFQRITDEYPTWKWPAYRAMFCAKPNIIAQMLPTQYQLDANGVEDEEVDRSLPAPDSYQGDNEGEATGIAPVIRTIDRDGTERWFDLNGHQLSGKPTKKGLYINKGNKVVIK